MTQALRQLAEDFLSAILFFAIYALTGSLFLGVGIGIAVGLGRTLWLKGSGRRVDAMQWMSLALVVVFGSATLVTHDPRLMMVKPTIIHWAIAGVMLRRGWMTRYMPSIVQQHVPQGTIVAAGYVWAGLMLALGLANVFIALRFDMATWAWFISFGAVGAKGALLTLQYATFRAIVRRRLRAAALPAPVETAPAISGR